MPKTIRSRVKKESEIAVIGSGVGGLIAALEFAEDGKKVIVIERKQYLLDGASSVTPGRMGLGFHYVHEDTAITYLRSTIEFVKKYKKEVPMLRIGEQFSEEHFLRRGRYFIAKDSLFSKEQIFDTYAAIQNEYRRLCEESSENQVFGLPENLFRILDQSEYSDKVNLDQVVCGIETAEQLLDWPSFRLFLIEKISNEKKITILTNCEIDSISFDPETQRHILIGNGQGEQDQFFYNIHSDFVINATWEYVQEITNRAGFITSVSKEKERTNRLKILVEVALPESLKNANSMFFCMGPHCMFSNMGDGRGLLTYAPVTNFMDDSAITMPDDMVRYLNANGSDQVQDKMARESKEYGVKIINGVSKYIPEMNNAKLMTVRFGVVITKGNVNIFDHNSPFHQRNYSGIEYNFPIGWINNTCMKLLYGYSNAVKLIEVQREHQAAKDSIPTLINEILEETKKTETSIDSSEDSLDNKPDASRGYYSALSYALVKHFTINELVNSEKSTIENNEKFINFHQSKLLMTKSIFARSSIDSKVLESKKLSLVNRLDDFSTSYSSSSSSSSSTS
jgi:hypothetical protein